ncbi:lactase-phlorizin hydrolase-like [Toxotes jaculatrix]|uniref:lactase-phlorizin hydrolase-like n=1 Tax=Toxotes jaculatrix TaxID=941984 RepID=UPI001B3ADD89|nr:lactase-phlorizin hydrolase-like [Toxotes jaculatrix]
MLFLGKLLSLCLISLYGCTCQKHDDQHQAMFLAGPMTNEQVKGLDRKAPEGALLDTFDCSHPIPPGSRQYFEYLQSRGVTHFKVLLSWAQLLPTGLPSQPQQAVVNCYQTLLRQLLEVGLQPLVVLHGSTVPDALRSRYGGWENQELVDMFQQYAEFVFGEFGELVDSWVTLSSLDELKGAELQNSFDAHARVYLRYHQLFPGKDGQVSVGVKGSKIAIISDAQQLVKKYLDFLSIKVLYDCTTGQTLAEELQTVMRKCGKKPVLLYEVNISDCSPYHFLSDTKILKGNVLYD